MTRMPKQYIVEMLLALQWGFVFCFSAIGGVLASECYLILKNPNHRKWHNIYYKIVLAIFVCSLSHVFYIAQQYDPRFENAFIALCGFLHFQLGSYIFKEFLPLVGNGVIVFLTKVLNKGGNKHD